MARNAVFAVRQGSATHNKHSLSCAVVDTSGARQSNFSFIVILLHNWN
jgi:hypothetical protein